MVVALVAVAGSGGCGGGQPIQPPPGSVELVLGGALPDTTGFLPLTGDVVLVPGGQGGFHVWMKYRITGAPAPSLLFDYNVRRVSDNRLILTFTRHQEVGPPGEAGYWESPLPTPAFMCPSPIGVQVRDEPMRFLVTVSTGPGAPPLATAEAQATPHCPTDDLGPFCLNICSG